MNERIKELARQCYETGPLGKDGWPEYTKFNEKKFVELIVGECVKEMGISKQCDPYTGEVYVSDYNRAVDDQISMLTEHFGVD